MRLGQLARKLAVRPADIAGFLAENNIRIAEGTNARLEKDQINLVMKRFVPGWIETVEVETEGEVAGNIGSIEPTLESPLPDEIVEIAIDSEVPQTAPPDTGEVIRAPKIELSGLKVVGKIELPEPKKKEGAPTEEGTPAAEVKREGREGRKTFDSNRRRNQRPEKNPIERQREMEAKDAQKKRQEQQAREKEKRTQNYLKNYKPAPPTKAVKLVREELVEMTPQDLEEPPKTLFGRIIRWLTKAS